MKKKYLWLLIGLIITGIGSITIISLNPAFANNQVENINSQYRFYYSFSPIFGRSTNWCITNVVLGVAIFGVMIKILASNNMAEQDGYTLSDKCKIVSTFLTIVSFMILFITSNFNGGFDNVTLFDTYTFFMISILLVQLVLIKAMHHEVSISK